MNLEDGYKEKEYSFSLTYIPDDNLEQYLIALGKDDVLDDYVLTQALSTIGSLILRAEDKFQDDQSIDFYDFHKRLNVNLAGIEELPSLTTLDLSGHNLDSINISKNTSLTSFFASLIHSRK